MSTEKKIRILSLDGGGIRGIIPATVMVHIEQRLKEFSNNPEAKIADYFDIIVGTSTGGILGCYYLVPDPSNRLKSMFTAQQALNLYVEKGYEIFNKSKKNGLFGMRQLFNATKYNPNNIERIFKEQLGDLKLNELIKPCIVTTYDMVKGSSFFFNSKDNPTKRDFYLRDVLRSTSAAPTYFPPAVIKNLAIKNEEEAIMVNIDGGVFANNPALCAYAEVRSKKSNEFGFDIKSDKMMMLSIGTGAIPTAYEPAKNPGEWGVIKWAKSAPEIMMDGALDTVNYQIKKIFGVEDNKNYSDNFIRVDFPVKLRENPNNLPYAPDMSDASPENIKKLQQAGITTVEKANEDKNNSDFKPLDNFIMKLVEIGLSNNFTT